MKKVWIQALGYKTFFMLNSAKHEIDPAHVIHMIFHPQNEARWCNFITNMDSSWLLWMKKVWIQAWGYKTFFMLNSAKHEIDPAHKC